MTTQEFRDLCQNVQSGKSIFLRTGERFDVWSDNTLCVYGYHFSNTASSEENPKGYRPVLIYMKDKKNVVIDGNGALIVVHGIMTPFIFDGCENITFRNFTIDYARPTMSEFTILENDGKGNCVIKIAADSLYDVCGNNLVWHGERGRNGNWLWESGYRDFMSLSMSKDPKTEWVQMMGSAPDCRFPCVPAFEKIEELGGNVLKVRLCDPNAFFPVGHTVQTRNTVRDQIGGAFVRCRNVLCENLTIHAMHGLGLLSQYCDTVTFRNLNITPSEGRTVASNADFFQVSGCKGLVTIENCVCSDGHDDFVNVHGTHLKIEEKQGKKIKVCFVETHSRGFCPFLAGDQIDFIDSRTLLPYGGALVLDVKMLNDMEFLLALDAEPDIKSGDVVENATWTPEVLIRNNRFGPSTGRGILCTTRRKVVIENNLFYKTGGNVLCIEDDCNFWYESGYTENVSFCNNTVDGCGYGSLGAGHVPVILVNPQVMEKGQEIYVHKKIAVENNVFRNLPDESYRAVIKYTEKFIFKGNRSDKAIRLETFCVKDTETE